MKRFDPYENTSGPLDNYQDSLELKNDPLSNYSDPMKRVDPFADNPGLFNEIINWSHDPMNKPQNQNKYFFSDGKTYYEQICKMLKLMAVFKDAFNQIYENEDEIHEAWENFVENLSATATAGDEASVTLVWTDESVQFEFVMPKGQKGDKGDQGDPGQDGVSISNITFNADYTMTITLSNGNTYTSPSLKGEKGDQGEGLEILDIYATLAELEQAHPAGQPGDAYLVGTDPNYTLYIWSTSQNDWLPAGSLTAPSPSISTPLMDGTASTGSENAYSRGDHVHPTDTSRASASDLTALSGTVTTLSTTVDTISGNVTQLQSDMTDAQGDITQLQSDLSDAQDDINDIEANVTQLQSDVTDISGDVSQLQTDVGTLDDRVDTLSDDLTVLEDIVTGSNNLDDQQFLYREAHTDHDTIARINSIKGNTVSFNQLVQNGNFADTSNWNVNNASFSVLNNIATITASDNDQYIYQEYPYVNGHKYYFKFSCKAGTSEKRIGRIYYGDYGSSQRAFYSTSTDWQSFSSIITFASTGNVGIIRLFSDPNGNQFKNVMLFDLTLMGIDNLTTTAEVEQWLSTHIGDLPYYDYTQGTLISFNGTGLKTVGFNQWDEEWEEGDISESTGENVNSNSRWRTTNYISIFPFTDYYIKTNYSSVALRGRFYDADKNYVGSAPYGATYLYSDEIFKTPQNAHYMRFSPNNSVFPDHMACVNISNAEKNGTYEPYTSNTFSLPTLTYFPTGMKSAGSVYDELTPSKATQRIGSRAYEAGDESNPDVITDGTTTYYALATPVETSISPELDLTYPVWQDGTEQILPENTSTPDTAPIRADFSYMSTDEAIQYLYDHISASVQEELDDLDERVSNVETAIGSETTTPMTGILGRLNEDETTMSTMETYVQKLSHGVNLGSSTLREAIFRYDDYSLTGNGYGQYDLNGTIPTGYIPIALMNVRTGNSNVVPVETMIDYGYNTYFRLTVRNLSSSTQTGQIWVEILCIKTY